MRTYLVFSILVAMLAGMAGFAMAAGEPAAPGGGGHAVLSGGFGWFFTAVSVASVLGLAIAAAGCGIAQGNAVARAVESIARQPESASRILTASMIGLAFIESLTIYVLVIALILIYANPFVQYIVG
ncbi:MAG TPA: ATP synthase F0 subunit C [bacterium]|nr:ATP synthase F0 subunit C [bacterium]